MEFQFIKKHLGEKWLEKEVAFLEKKEWIKRSELKEKIGIDVGLQVLKKIDDLIQKLENVKGFNKWVIDARESRSFKDFLFEIMVFENLYRKADEMEIKPDNHGKTPEALIKKGSERIYVEAKNLEGVPSSPGNKINTFLADARAKFKLGKGILFIGCFGLFSYEGNKPITKKEFNDLRREVERKLNNHRENSRIIAVVLTNIYAGTDFKIVSFQKRYFLVPRPAQLGGFDETKFKDLFDVDGWVLED